MLREPSTRTASTLRCGSTVRTTRTGRSRANRKTASAERRSASSAARDQPAVRADFEYTHTAAPIAASTAMTAMAPGKGGLKPSSPCSNTTGRYLKTSSTNRSNTVTSCANWPGPRVLPPRTRGPVRGFRSTTRERDLPPIEPIPPRERVRLPEAIRACWRRSSDSAVPLARIARGRRTPGRHHGVARRFLRDWGYNLSQGCHVTVDVEI